MIDDSRLLYLVDKIDGEWRTLEVYQVEENVIAVSVFRGHLTAKEINEMEPEVKEHLCFNILSWNLLFNTIKKA